MSEAGSKSFTCVSPIRSNLLRIFMFRVEGRGIGFLGSGLRVQGTGYMVQGAGFRVQGTGLRVQGAGFRVQGTGLKSFTCVSPIRSNLLEGLMFRVWGLGFRVQGSGFSVQGTGFGVQGSGFRVQCAGCRVQGSSRSRACPRSGRTCFGISRLMTQSKVVAQ